MQGGLHSVSRETEPHLSGIPIGSLIREMPEELKTPLYWLRWQPPDDAETNNQLVFNVADILRGATGCNLISLRRNRRHFLFRGRVFL